MIVAIAVARQAPNLRDNVIITAPELAREDSVSVTRLTSAGFDAAAHEQMVQAGQCINATHRINCATSKLPACLLVVCSSTAALLSRCLKKIDQLA